MTKPLFLLLLMICPVIQSLCRQPEKNFRVQAGQSVVIACDAGEEPVVHAAIDMLCNDWQAVLASRPQLTGHATPEADILIGTLGKSPLLSEINLPLQELQNKDEAFLLTIVQRQNKPCLVIAGSDKRGTAYGILQLSRLLGVSPWEWWADATPTPRKEFALKNNFRDLQSPAVAFRGIFLNDEDWGLMPWSWQTHEPSQHKGELGPKTHERIFQLLLRLRANAFWPAMHECSQPFFLTAGNREMAEKYSIFIGTSHCEPMMCNANGEWKVRGEGQYDFVHNREQVLRFWEERVKQVAAQDNLYTLGIRGVHDGRMQGAKTIAEQKAAITQILNDQRNMLARLVNPDITKVPQVFIPYKEVLDVYHAGLRVPDDITLMWCDDNYGYIRHFPDSVERARKGGNGVYYHISYWGRPHDYLWLGTTHPALICNQMQQAWHSGIQKLWILNVGDIKPGEYLTELFLDMAWAPDKITPNSLEQHLTNWLQREFGENIARKVTPLMQEYYRLAYIRKPEFMANTRVEEQDPRYKIVSDLPWSEQEIRERLQQYQYIADKINQLTPQIPVAKQAAWFQLIQYPVLAANEMNKKLLYAQLARHNKADGQLSQTAYDSIIALTHTYNTIIHGKWNRIMDAQPRKLPVFQPVPSIESASPLKADIRPYACLNGTDYSASQGNPHWSGGMGYAGQAVALPAGSSVTYRFKQPLPDTIYIQTALVPTHPVNGATLRYQIKIDDEEMQTVDYHTQGRSEEWKQNVLRNQALRTTKHTPSRGKIHTLTIRALDEGVLIDQIKVFREI